MIKIQDLRLSAQRALLGNITSHVRVVKVSSDKDIVSFTAIIDEDSDDLTLELLSEASTEIIADFGDADIRENIFRDSGDLPKEDFVAEGWVYARANKYHAKSE